MRASNTKAPTTDPTIAAVLAVDDTGEDDAPTTPEDTFDDPEDTYDERKEKAGSPTAPRVPDTWPWVPEWEPEPETDPEPDPDPGPDPKTVRETEPETEPDDLPDVCEAPTTGAAVGLQT